MGWPLTLGLSVLALLGLEFLARWWIRQRSAYHVFAPGLRLHMQVDLDQVPGLDPLVRFEINRDGERGPAPPRRGSDQFRVLTCGGSAAEGFLLDEPRSWAGALRSHLERPQNRRRLGCERVHVGSVGRSRTGAQALDLIFEKTLPRYRNLSAVVIMVGATDVVEWFEVGAPSPWKAPDFSVAQVFAEHPQVSFGFRPTSWGLVQATRRLLRRILRPVQHRTQAGSSLQRVRQMRAQAREIIREIPEPRDMLEHFEHHLRSLVARAQRHAKLVLVLGQPCFDRNHTPEVLARFWDFGVGNPYQGEVTRYFSMDLAGRVMNAMNRCSGAVAQELGVPFLDLGSLMEPDLELYYDFLHFTPKGAARVGTLIAEEILAHINRQGGPTSAGPKGLRRS